MLSLVSIVIFLLPLKSPKLASTKDKLPFSSVLKNPPLTKCVGKLNVYESDKSTGATIVILLRSLAWIIKELSILTVDILH